MSTEPAAEPAPIDFDPYSATYFDDPYDLYRRLRDEEPVHHNADIGFYALSRWDDVVDAARDWSTYSSAYGIELDSLLAGEVIHDIDSLIMMDPPKHDRLRALVSRVFTPRSISGLEPMVREVIVGYLDELDGRDQVDLLSEFAAYFPVEIISRMLGIPAERRQDVRLWLDVALHREVGQRTFGEENTAAMVAMGTYFYELAVEKRAHPVDDMLSRLTQVEVEDDDGNLVGLSDVDIAGFGTLIGGAGAETVTKLVGNAVVLFGRHPDQWQLVRDDPSLIPGAFEELLRILPPSQFQGRMTVRDVELHGTTIPARSPVLLLTGAATRDERAFTDPDRFDITRPPALSLGFGHGIHSCLGAALARMEGRIAVEELAQRYPRYEVDTDGLRRVQMTNVAGYSNVPIRVG
ncbi:cytochrome P450 [Aquihabitans sp. McL0605]|uniref:cytochrome P450 n=1 Tax=Aquihabitans sp. McL0605 TaxID=3415671 RepID=UPI003CF31A08